MTIISEKRRYFYCGEVSNLIPHGNGQEQNIDKKTGEVYQGRFEQGKRSGKGSLRTNKGVMYIGEFKNNFKDGYGEEEVYRNSKKALQKGQSKIKRKSLYKGNFKEGMRDGDGTEETSHGNYHGDWKQNVKHGYGEMNYHNGD